MAITAPYGFVPLSDKVVCPDWLKYQDKDGKLASPPIHDVPFEDGLCGTLELEITAETPIFMRGTEDPELPFQLKDGRYAIPGTALRGALRNIVEIASFSRFIRVNNHRYAVRDLNNRHLYGQYMADIVRDPRTGKGEPMPLVNAGWLIREGEGDEVTYKIEVCDFAKIEYRALMDLARERGVRNFRPGEKQSSVNKYNTWGEHISLEIEASVTWKRPETIGRRKMPSKFGVAKPMLRQEKGTLVMTGQPSRWTPDQTGKRAGAGNAKHHDFVFFPAKQKQTLLVPIQTFQDFEFAHSNRGQQNNLGRSQEPNEEWKFWRNKMEKEEKVPVFFLTMPDGRVGSFGLAMMYRLPYEHSIHEAISNVAREHLDRDKGLDLAEGIFGTGEDKEQRDRERTLALKGRVGISHALATSPTKPERAVSAVLGAPKASYYPNYVEQGPGTYGGQPAQDSRGNAVYQTWMDRSGAPRGWKRYRTMTETYNPPPPSGGGGRQLDLSNVATRFQPLPAGTKFVALIDIHNLKPEELGALVWAIELGGDEKARHTLGMARPLGFGRSRMRLISHDLDDMRGGKPDLQACRNAFEEWITGDIRDWKSSPQIKELLALAHPVSPNKVRYQRLDPGQRLNEFVDAKKNGLALPSVVNHGGSTTRVVVPPQTGRGSSTAGTVRAKVIEKTTKKGGVMFEIVGTGEEGILHPTSQQPPDLNPGAEYEFTVMARAKPVSLKWLDPSAPPPSPAKSSKPGSNRKPGHRGKPGFRR
ncbi:MAG: TIGR03986 family CRISPR-associated RAMP protein [Vulcanimicrobiota bacterium]